MPSTFFANVKSAPDSAKSEKFHSFPSSAFSSSSSVNYLPSRWVNPTPAPSIHLRPVTVTNHLYCPNIRCNIKFKHVHEDLRAVSPCPPHMPQMLVERFHPFFGQPFPDVNIWRVSLETTFHPYNKMTVFIFGYGVVTLRRWISSNLWDTYECIDPQGIVVARIALLAAFPRRKGWKDWLRHMTTFLPL